MAVFSFVFCSFPPRAVPPSDLVGLLGAKLTFVSLVAVIGFQQYSYFRDEVTERPGQPWVPGFFTCAFALHFATAAPVLISLGLDLWMLMYGARPALCSLGYAGLWTGILVFCVQGVRYFRGVRQELLDAGQAPRPSN